MKILLLIGLISAHAFLLDEIMLLEGSGSGFTTEPYTIATGTKDPTYPGTEDPLETNAARTEDPDWETTTTEAPEEPGTKPTTTAKPSEPTTTGVSGNEGQNTTTEESDLKTTTSKSTEEPGTKPTTTAKPSESTTADGPGNEGVNTTTEEPMTGTTWEPLKTETTEEDQGQNLALILGLTFGCTAAVAFGGVGVWYFFFRKNTVEIADVETVQNDEASAEE